MSIKDKLLKKKEELKEKKEKTKKFINTIQLIITYFGVIFFIYSSISSVIKNYQTSKYYPYIIGSTVVYLIIFIIFVIFNAKNKDNLKKETKEFKSTFKFLKTILSLVFDVSALLILLESLSLLQQVTDLELFIKTIISGIVLFWKILMALRKIRKFIKKKVKASKKNKVKQDTYEDDED